MKSTFATLLLFISAQKTFAIPDWVKLSSEKLNGKIYVVTCYGEGPALEIARNQAKDGCLSSASRQVITQFNVKTLTVETETSVGLHQEVSSDQLVSGLSCRVNKEEIVQSESQFKIWIQCEYDLSKAKSESTQPVITKATANSGDPISNRKELKEIKVKSIQTNSKNIFSNGNRTLIIKSIPQCESVLVEGTQPRIKVCSNNPTSITLLKGDARLIVRAKNYQPKVIQLNSESTRLTTVEVILEEN